MTKEPSHSALSFYVEPELIEGRRDVAYYQPTYLSLDLRMKQLKSVPLREIAELSKLLADPTKDPEKEFTYVDIGSVDTISGDIFPQRITGRNAPSRARKLVKHGDIIISTVRPNRNAVAFISRNLNDAICSTGFAVVKARKIEPYYLFAFLKTDYAIAQLVRRTTATMYPAVSEDDIANIKIPLLTQKSRNAIMEIMQEALEARKQKLESSGELRSKIDEVLCNGLGVHIPISGPEHSYWIDEKDLQNRRDVAFYHPKYVSLDKELHKSPYAVGMLGDAELSIQITDGHHGNPEYVDKGVPYLRVINVEPFKVKLDEFRCISEKQAKAIGERCQIKANDVLLSIVGTIGVAAVVPEDIQGYVISRDLAKIVLTRKLNRTYLAAFLNSKLGRFQMERMSTGAVQKGFYLASVKSLKLPIPPIDVQNGIAKEIQGIWEEAERLRTQADEAMEKAKEQVENMIEGDIQA